MPLGRFGAMSYEEMDAEGDNPAGKGGSMAIRAFRVTVEDFDDDCIVFAEKAGKARFVAWSSAKDAGFNFEFKDMKVRREPEYDEKSWRFKPYFPYGESAMQAMP